MRAAPPEVRMVQQPDQKIAISTQALDRRLAQRVNQFANRGVTALAARDQFGQHRVVMDAHLHPALDPGVNPQPFKRGQLQVEYLPGGRQEIVSRVFGVKPRLDRVTFGLQIALAERQRMAFGDLDLQPDQVESGDHLRDGMLDLQARVDFDEIELARGPKNKFDRARVRVTDGAANIDSRLAHLPPQFFTDRRRRALLDDLLMAALQRTIALEQMNKIAARVAQDLKFDVARALDIFLYQQRAVAESLLGLAPSGLDGAVNCAFGSHDAHALAAAARRGLYQNRKADFDHPRAQRFGALILAVVTRDDRRACLGRQPAR